MNESGKLVALLFYSAEPLSRRDLCKTFAITESELAELVTKTDKQLSTLGLTIVQSDKLSLATQTSYASLIEEFYQSTPQQLSQAALEVLSIIAYKQPITKAKVDEIRGVSSEQSIKNLINKQMIKKTVKNNHTVYSTTTEFLQAMGINKIKDLPQPNDNTKA